MALAARCLPPRVRASARIRSLNSCIVAELWRDSAIDQQTKVLPERRFVPTLPMRASGRNEELIHDVGARRPI